MLSATPTPVATATPVPTTTPIVTVTTTPVITTTISLSPTASIMPTVVERPIATTTLIPTPIPLILEISNIQITQIVDGVQICWNTNLPTTGYVKFGTDASNLIVSTLLEKENATEHCQALTTNNTNLSYFYEITALTPEDNQTKITGSFQVIIPRNDTDKTTEFTSNSCRIEQPRITGDTESGFSLMFSTDNNEQVICSISLGSEVNDLIDDGTIVQREVDGFKTKISTDKLPLTNTLSYQIVCRSIDNECSFTDKIDLKRTLSQDTNLLAKILGPTGSEITTQLGAIALTDTAKTTAIGVAAISAATFAFSYPQIFWVGLIWIYRRPKHKRFGLVYDSNSKVVVPFAVIRLLEQSSRKVVAETVSDLQGRYNLLAGTGTYILEVNQDTYSLFTLSVTLSGNDLQVTTSIPLSKNGMAPGKRLQFHQFLQKLNKLIFALGFGFSILILLLNFYIINIIIVGIYMFQMLLLIIQKPPRGWGRITEAGTGKKLKGAFISILDPVEQRQIDIQMSDMHGNFGFILEKQDYLLKINLPGYKLKGINHNWPSLTLPSGETAYTIPKGEVTSLDIEMEAEVKLGINNLGAEKFGSMSM